MFTPQPWDAGRSSSKSQHEKQQGITNTPIAEDFGRLPCVYCRWYLVAFGISYMGGNSYAGILIRAADSLGTDQTFPCSDSGGERITDRHVREIIFGNYRIA